MFWNIARNKGSELLIDLVVLVMTVHSANIVENVFINHASKFFVLQFHLSEQKLDSVNWDKDVLGSENHYASNALLTQVRMQGRTKFLH